MRIYDNKRGIYVNAIASLAISNTNVAGHLYDLHAPGYFAQLIFQRGDGSKPEENGVTTEAVLAAVLHRLEHLDSLLPCPENVSAISHIQQALFALEARQNARAEQGVLGTNLPHQSVLLDIGVASDAEAAQAIASGLVQDDDAPAALQAAANIPSDPASHPDNVDDTTPPPAGDLTQPGQAGDDEGMFEDTAPPTPPAQPEQPAAEQPAKRTGKMSKA